MEINRSEVWLIDLNPVIGHEQSGVRPVLVISDDLFNHSLAEMVIVVPITSKYKGIPTHVELEGSYLSQKSYIKTEDIRSVSTKRLIKRIGRVEDKVMKMVEDRIKLLLSLT
jgi:mRNA interferase MazF